MASSVRAAIIYDNISASSGASSATTNGITSDQGGPLGDSFSNGSTTSKLLDVKLLMDDPTPADGSSFVVQLYSDSSASPKAVLNTLATVPDSALTTGLTALDIPVTASISLAANTRYWIILSTTSSTAQWSYANNDNGVGVSTEYNYGGGGPSPNTSGFTPFQATVTNSAGAVPEPTSLSLLCIGTLGLLRRRSPRAVGI